MIALNNIESVLKRLKEDHQALFGESAAPGITTFNPILRPYSLVVRARLEWKDRSVGLYVKVPLNSDDGEISGHIREEYMLLSWFNERLPVESGYAVIRPLRFYDEYNALVTEEADGTALDVMMKKYGKGLFRSNNNLSAHYRRCGEWLREFQALPVPPFCRPYLADEAADFVLGQVKRCGDGGLVKRGLLSGISAFVDEVTRRRDVPDYPVVPMHSDFIPSNIIARRDGISVLDFGACWSGPACRDVATFLNTLDGIMVNPFFRPATIERLKSEFLKGYRWNPKEETGELFRIFEVREILGRLLQLSKRIKGTRSKLMYHRMQGRSVRRLCEIIGH